MSNRYAAYKELLVEPRENGVLLITLNRPKVLNAMTYAMHTELANIWDDVARDPKTRVAVITGAGRAFCSGNDLNNPDPDLDMVREIMSDAVRIVRGMIECDKPVVSAINGVAVGAGLAIAVLADISVCAEDAKLIDAHTTVGTVAGDHGCLLWPMLCGLAKAKFYMFNMEPLTGKEAERIGVVTKAVPTDQVLPLAMEYADRLADMAQHAIRGTKRSMNGWLRQAMPIFEHSVALEMVDFLDADIVEARQAFREKRKPKYPSAQ